MQAESSASSSQRESSIVFDDNLGKCRCCLTPGKHQYNFGKAELEMLMENLNLFLMADPSLPRLLCVDCVTSLNDVQRFRQKVMASESELRRAMTEDIKPESIGQTPTDPLEISHVKTEHDYEEALSEHSGTDDDTAESGDCKRVKIEFEPSGETSKGSKIKSSIKTEKEKGSNKSDMKPLEKELKPKRLRMVAQSKGLRLVPINKDLRLVPEGSKELRLLPINSKTSSLVPINTKTSGLVPINSKTSGLVPINSKGLRLVPQSGKGLRLVPINGKGSSLVPINSKDLRLIPHTSKGLRLVPISSKGLLCVEPLTDVSTNTNNEKGRAIKLKDRKRRIKDGKTETKTKRKKSDSESDELVICEAKEEKIDAKAALARLESSRHLLLKDNSKVRSNIILILKHSTILPFRNNFKFAFKCFYCDMLCIPFKDLKHHIETEHNDVSLTTINKIVRTMQNLIVTADISCIRCRICDEKCDSIETLIEHLCKVHEKEYHETDRKPSHGILGVDLSNDTLKCHICNMEHTFFKNLLVHMNEHYGVFVCYVCGKKFLSDRRYKSHVISTHANKEIKCKQCSKIFKTVPAMKYHVKRVHLKTRVKCLYCPETFTSGNYVKRLNHMAEVHGITKPVFKCDMCGKELANSASLAHHKMYTHKRTKINRCEICDYMTCNNSAMKKHMVVHSGEKNFECEFCKKTFAKLGTLKLHLKIHFNDRKFVCFICETAFIQKNSLKNHLQSRHPDSGVDINSL